MGDAKQVSDIPPMDPKVWTPERLAEHAAQSKKMGEELLAALNKNAGKVKTP